MGRSLVQKWQRGKSLISSYIHTMALIWIWPTYSSYFKAKLSNITHLVGCNLISGSSWDGLSHLPLCLPSSKLEHSGCNWRLQQGNTGFRRPPESQFWFTSGFAEVTSSCFQSPIEAFWDLGQKKVGCSALDNRTGVSQRGGEFENPCFKETANWILFIDKFQCLAFQCYKLLSKSQFILKLGEQNDVPVILASGCLLTQLLDYVFLIGNIKSKYHGW